MTSLYFFVCCKINALYLITRYLFYGRKYPDYGFYYDMERHDIRFLQLKQINEEYGAMYSHQQIRILLSVIYSKCLKCLL